MKAQQLEDRPAMKIKFASIIPGPGNHLASDANEEYSSLFDDVPAEWVVLEDGQIPRTVEGMRQAWLLRREGVEIAVVAHETGLEIVIGVAGTIAVGVAVELAKDAVVGFTKWLWRRWKGLRAEKVQKQTAVDTSLRLVCYTAQLPGVTFSTLSLDVLAPLTEEAVSQCVAKFLADYGLPLPPSPPPPSPEAVPGTSPGE